MQAAFADVAFHFLATQDVQSGQIGPQVCRFVEQGGLSRENGQRFREAILSRGNSTDLAELYRQWRGHDPQIEPMLENRGLS